jgi:hypothetical protein
VARPFPKCPATSAVRIISSTWMTGPGPPESCPETSTTKTMQVHHGPSTSTHHEGVSRESPVPFRLRCQETAPGER